MDLIFILVALGVGLSMGLPGASAPPLAVSDRVIEAPTPEPAPEIAQDAPIFTPLPVAPAAPEPMPGFTAEDQTPTGKFTTAAEVRMILGATTSNWVAVREYDGQDLIYLTHLLAWRCGLHQISFAVNGGPDQVFPAEPCYLDTAQPNAIKADTVLPYVTAPLGSVQTVTISLLYDDLGTAQETFSRSAILLP